MDNWSGRTIKGYELLERIGAGGFGAVYRARQTTVDREVAIKIILPGFANQPDFIRRFESEAQVVARLEHPYITPLYDYWRDPNGAYLVMRYLRGGSFHDALKDQPYGLESTVAVLDQISSALALAHRCDVIHRDLKPGNILLDEDGNAYLADFGIAKVLGDIQRSLTKPDAVVGSLDYISPEQARGEPVTPRTDIYSLGVVLYEMLTGQHPFPNCSSVERLYKHINDPLPLIESLDPAVRDEVNAVIQQATAKDPAHRYADVLALAAAFRDGARVGATPSPESMVLQLTFREQEVLQCVVDGLSNKEIANHLFISEPTVKWHIRQLYRKLSVRSRVQAIVRARELDLIVSGNGEPDLQVKSGPATSTTGWPEPENPYKGLLAFQTADHRDFFGREELTDKLIERLAETGKLARFLAVIGPSGSGKSSLVKAGLIPALWAGKLPGSEKWFVVDMLPGPHPLDELEVALTRLAADQAGNLHEHLRRDPRGLLRAAGLILPNDGSELVLIVDQFEEVFTLVGDEAERAHFLDLLQVAVTEARSRVRVVITLRADFYDRPLRYPEFGELVRQRMETVLPLTAKGLERAVLCPAQRVGVQFEEGLAATIVGEMNYQAGALPLLQYALTELFERREGRLLTQRAYQEIGGAVGALAMRADEVYRSLGETEQELTRQMFLRLVTLGEGVEDTRRRAPRSELLAIAAVPMPGIQPQTEPGQNGRLNRTDLMDEIIDTYAAYRLLSLDHDPGTRSPTVEVAHEAVLREWERLRQWLNDCREEIRLQRQLAAMAAEWRTAGQDASFLLHGSRLEMFEVWVSETRLALTPKERQFLEASLKQREIERAAEIERQAREKALEHRSILFLRVLAAVLVIAALGAIGLSLVAFDREHQAQDARATSEWNAGQARQLALINGARAALAENDPDTALVLAMAANDVENPLPEAQVILADAAYRPGTVRLLASSPGTDYAYAYRAAFSPDGMTALSGAENGSATLWDADPSSPTFGSAIRTLQPDESGGSMFLSLAFMRGENQHLALLLSNSGQLIIWDTLTGAIAGKLASDIKNWGIIRVSSDGRRMISGGCIEYDDTGTTCLRAEMVLWDLVTRSELLRREFGDPSVSLRGIALSPDGRTALTTGCGDAALTLWDVDPESNTFGQDIRHVAHDKCLGLVDLSPDGRFVASGTEDTTVIVWDTKTYTVVHELALGGQMNVGVCFSPDSQTLLARSNSNIIWLWNVETGEEITRLYGHKNNVQDASFSPDSRRILSVGEGTVRLWDLQNGALVRVIKSPLPPAPDVILRLPAITLDGQAIFIAGDVWHPTDYRDIAPAALVDLATNQVLREFPGPNRGVPYYPVRLSPDGTKAVIIGGNEIRFWEIATGDLLLDIVLEADQKPWSADFSPDGRWLLSIHNDFSVILWDFDVNSATFGQILHEFVYSDDAVLQYILFGPDGQTGYLSTDSGTVIVFDVVTGDILRRLGGENPIVVYLAFSPDGNRLLGGTMEGILIEWDVATGQETRRLVGQSERMFSIRYSPDGRFVFVDSMGHGTGMYDVATGEPVRHFDGIAALLSSDGEYLYTSVDLTNVTQWRIDTQAELLEWTRQNRYIRDLSCDERKKYQIAPLCAVQ